MALSRFLLLLPRRHRRLSSFLAHSRLLSSSTSPASSLSSRMSSVFEHLDTLRRDRQERDEALQRIRAWRHNTAPAPSPEEDLEEEKSWESAFRKEVELAHPWPEWIELLERLLHQKYFDRSRVAADGEEEGEVGPELTADWDAVSAAVENFGKDRFDILRSLSRKDIEVLVDHGCPSADGKVVYSAKLLRKYVHVNEGDVCSSCSLRSSCRRGFLILGKEDEARTLDVMRVLLMFAFHSITGSVKNEPLMKMKSIKTIIRKLLHEIVKLSAVPIDPNLPRPIIKKAPPKVKQPPPPPKKRVGRDDVEMKKGDWICSKCDFMNFAKNGVCLQCDAKRPKRQLLPGEWECPQCNFLNYRRNITCFHCECKRPADEYMENQVYTNQHTKDRRMPDITDAWNFDFDDHESDGAEVAAFEFADPPRKGKGSTQGGPLDVRGSGHDFVEDKKQRINGMRHLYESNKNQIHGPRTGFDDFEEDEDDVDSYEIASNGEQVSQIPHRKLSESASEYDDDEDLDGTSSNQRTNKSVKTSFSDSQDRMPDLDYSDVEFDSDCNDVGQDFSHSLSENSRSKSTNHHVGRNRISKQDTRNNRWEIPTIEAQVFRRPLRGEGFVHNRSKNDMGPNRDEFTGSARRFQRRKPHDNFRPSGASHGERFGYNERRGSNKLDDSPKAFGDRPRRRIIER